jgi:hypothetical protein
VPNGDEILIRVALPTDGTGPLEQPPPVERSCLVVAESQAPAAAPRRRTRVPSAQLTLVVPPPDPAESVPGTTAGGAAVPADVVLVQDAATLATCRAAVAASGEVDLDIETTGLSPYTAAILTIQLWCESDGRTYVILPAYVDRAALLDILGLLPEREVGAHNAAFEWSFLAAHFGIRLRRIWDSQVIEDVLQAGRGPPPDPRAAARGAGAGAGPDRRAGDGCPARDCSGRDRERIVSRWTTRRTATLMDSVLMPGCAPQSPLLAGSGSVCAMSHTCVTW